MNKHKISGIISPQSAGFILLFVLFFVAGHNVFAQTKKKTEKKKVPELEINFGLATIYDDNILKYSDKYLERFMNGEDYGRFHIDTYDDIILNPTLQIVSSYRFIGKLKSEFSVDFNPRFYMVNDIKNWSSFAVGYRQFFTKKASFKLSYSYIPDFYIRHFRDDDWVEVYRYTPETFQPMEFSKDMLSFYIHNTFFKNTGVRLTLGYAKYYYNEHFTEYDSDDLSFAVRFIQPLHKKVKMEIGYIFTNSDANAYDEPGEIGENSDDADADFDEDGFILDLTWQLPEIKKFKNSLGANAGYERRYYTTDNSVFADPEHRGRLDEILSLAFDYNIKLNKSLQLTAFYRWIGRNSGTNSVVNSEYVSIEKDYRQGQVGLEIDYTIKY
jgi:hypothetical protein